MKVRKIKIVVIALVGFLMSGCGQKEDASSVACKKLLVNCSKNDNHWPMKFEIRKKANEYIDLHEQQVRTNLSSLNLKLSKFRKNTFDVDVLSHQNIEQLLHPYDFSPQAEKKKNKKLENLAVFSAGTSLLKSTIGHQSVIGVSSENSIQVKTDSKAFSRYKAIVEICEHSFVVDCRIAFKGRVDGVWTKQGEFSKVLTGWIYLDEVIVLNVDFENTKESILDHVEKDALKLIYDLKGDISWKQIEKIVDDKVDSIN